MTFSFFERSKRLENICKKTNLKKKTHLISEGNINKKNLSFIQEASKNLLYASIIGKNKHLTIENDYKSIIRQIKQNTPNNITHNGLVVPRKENSLEYALFLKSIFCFLSSTGLDKIIEYLVSPPQLRIKLGNKSKNFNASENIHSDAWTNYNTDKSYTLYFPIFGDAKRNFVTFYKPKKSFDPNWLSPKKFVDGAFISKHYEKAKVDYKFGKFIVSDCATLHQSILKKNASPRVSIDLAFIPKHTFKKPQNHSHVKLKEIENTGYNQLMLFKDSFNDSLKKILSRKNKQSLHNRRIINY